MFDNVQKALVTAREEKYGELLHVQTNIRARRNVLAELEAREQQLVEEVTEFDAFLLLSGAVK